MFWTQTASFWSLPGLTNGEPIMVLKPPVNWSPRTEEEQLLVAGLPIIPIWPIGVFMLVGPASILTVLTGS